MKPAAVLFDLDGTLVDCEEETIEAMAQVLLNEHDLAIDSHDRAFVVGRSWSAIHERLVSRYPNLRLGKTELVQATTQKRSEYLAHAGLRILPGAVSAVRRFGHVPRAVVTGSSTIEATFALRTLGLERDFSCLVTADDLTSSKPEPDGYLLAAKRLGVCPQDCLVVEDSCHGIAAGIAAGMRVIAVGAGNFAAHDQSAAHEQIETLRELTESLVSRVMVRSI